jgi:hypothetical protein
MKLERLQLALIVGILLAIAIAIGLGEVPDGHGRTDPVFETLQLGGEGPARIAPVLWLGWLIGALQIAFFMTCLELGLRRRVPEGEPKAPWRRSLWLGGAAFEAVWAALVAVYWRYASSGSLEIWWGLPAPTAIMLYGVWLLPLVFCLFYVVHFDRWVMSEADLARFRKLVAEAGAGDSSPNAKQESAAPNGSEPL